jgi:hypothetical protein
MLGRIDAVVSKLECTMMDSDTCMRTEYLMCSDRFRGFHVNQRHEPGRIVSANWQQRQARRTELRPNLPKMTAESGILRERAEVDRLVLPPFYRRIEPGKMAGLLGSGRPSRTASQIGRIPHQTHHEKNFRPQPQR